MGCWLVDEVGGDTFADSRLGVGGHNELRGHQAAHVWVAGGPTAGPA